MGPVRSQTIHRVLIVDDNIDAAEMLSEYLQELGYQARVAEDGRSALDVALEFAPELGLVDLGLPVMDGYQLAAQLRHKLPNCRLVSISGYGLESDRERSRAAGFETHLVKPVSLERIRALIEEPAS